MFSETLKVDLVLNIKNRNFCIPGGNVKEFSVDIDNCGFQAEVSFVVSNQSKDGDNLIKCFPLHDLIEVSLSVQGVYNLPDPKPEPLILRGLVTKKSFHETAFADVRGNPVLFRRYSIHVADTAQVLWKQHFPLNLYVDSNMSTVIKDHIVEGISVKMDWDKLESKYPLLCLGLGGDENKASFYDFLLWYIDSHNGVWNYDSQKNVYQISGKKDTIGKTLELKKTDVERHKINIPEILRFNINVLNASAETPKSVEVEHKQAVTGIRQDKIIRTPITSAFDDYKHLETSRLKNGNHELEIYFSQFPNITFRPGTFISLAKELWSSKIYPANKDYRVYKVSITAQAENQHPEHDLDESFTKYQLDMTGDMEEKNELRLYIPPYENPQYPIFVEGKIISQSGEESDKTYMVVDDKETSLDFYKINIPLWEKDILVLFEPNFFVGSFYFPAFKHSRVLLSLYFDYAEIKHFLDWGDGARLPFDSQGNHILFGKNATDETSMKYVYEDNKPVFSIQRTRENDTELVRLEDGSIILQTKEE